MGKTKGAPGAGREREKLTGQKLTRKTIRDRGNSQSLQLSPLALGARERKVNRTIRDRGHAASFCSCRLWEPKVNKKDNQRPWQQPVPAVVGSGSGSQRKKRQAGAEAGAEAKAGDEAEAGAETGAKAGPGQIRGRVRSRAKVVYVHNTLSAPVLVRSPKSNNVEPSQYLDG